MCIEKQQALRGKRIYFAEYKIWKEIDESKCNAKEYGKYSSVSLESKFAPVFLGSQLNKN